MVSTGLSKKITCEIELSRIFCLILLKVTTYIQSFVISPITKLGVAEKSRSGDTAFLDCSYILYCLTANNSKTDKLSYMLMDPLK